MEKMNVYQKLAYVQQKLKVNKDRGKGHNPYAQVTYEYRNAEDILEGVKEHLESVGAAVIVDCTPVMLGEGVPVDVRTVGKDRNNQDIFAVVSGPRPAAKAVARFIDTEDGKEITATAFAFIDFWRKGQTEPEKLCGSADSYASKYALSHLFAIDNNRDADQESDEAKDSSGSARASQPAAKTTQEAARKPQDSAEKPKVSKAKAEAWNAFKTLPEVAKLDKEARNKYWGKFCKDATNKEAKDMTDADWGKVLADIDVLKAM